MSKTNPFAVQTPESIPAAEVVSLFVNVFSDFYHIPTPGHTFVHGPRGSGKTMMFRFLEPDCQLLTTKLPLHQLDFFGVYVPVKNTALDLTEFLRLQGSYADTVLSEHFMAVHVVAKLLVSLVKSKPQEDLFCPGLRELYKKCFVPLIANAGGSLECPDVAEGVASGEYLSAMQKVIERMHTDVISYLRRLSFSSDAVEYRGALTGFLDFVVPLMHCFKDIQALPSGPIYLLIDDADNLNETQTRILNSWVATRTTADICLKISTQLAYKTLRTTSDQRITSPHDFSEVNISGVYTSRGSKYQLRMREIVEKRLADRGVSPDEFFPENREQEKRIDEIRNAYLSQPKEASRGYSPGDDASRYARPDYFKLLKETRGGRTTYSYAGFEQLIHISSGVVRHFLDAASVMYAEEQSSHDGREVNSIAPGTQDRVVRELADRFYFKEFDKITEEESLKERKTQLKRLRNIIYALGTAFHEILVSSASDRRVFSVALSDGGEPDVIELLRLGVRYGYFHEATIGAKVGMGRVPLFVLTRRLAPFFSLDPTSFAGYQFCTSEALRGAADNPWTFIQKIKGKRGMASVFDDPQLPLPLEATHD